MAFIVPTGISRLLSLAGEFVEMALLTVLLPVYALLLASIFLVVFVVLAGFIVPVARFVLYRGRSEALGEGEEAEPRKAA